MGDFSGSTDCGATGGLQFASNVLWKDQQLKHCVTFRKHAYQHHVYVMTDNVVTKPTQIP